MAKFGEWLPIDTAPNDGRRMLLWMKPRSWLPAGAITLNDLPPIEGYDTIKVGEREFSLLMRDQYVDVMGVTHWMPLPDPPSEA